MTAQLVGGAEATRNEEFSEAISSVLEKLRGAGFYEKPSYDPTESLEERNSRIPFLLAFLNQYDKRPHYSDDLEEGTPTSLLKNIFASVQASQT